MRCSPLVLALSSSFIACGSAPVPETQVIRDKPAAPPVVTAAAPLPIDIRLMPVCGRDGEPTALDVEVSLDAWDPANPPVFRISDEVFGDLSARDIILDPRMADARGEIPIASDVTFDQKDEERRLLVRGTRSATGKVTLRYRARSIPTTEKGPRFGLRHDAYGMAGTSAHFLIVPNFDDTREFRVGWVTSQCKSDLQPTSALGPGPGPHRYVGEPDSLRQTGFFFGRTETIAVDEGNMHIRLLFLGKPSFDTRVAAKYAGDALRAERAAFGDEDPTPFYALMRVLPEMTRFVVGGGNPQGYSSVVGPDAPWDFRMRNHIAHEFLHHWIGIRVWMKDAADVSGYWFTEGFTVHYSRVIPLRVGLATPAEVLEHINKLALAYYTSPLRAASNVEIDKGIAGAVGSIPYWRGSFYAAELDGAIRFASKGARSLDDLMRDILRRAKDLPRGTSGMPELTESAFRDLVFVELGQSGVDRFDAVIRRGEVAKPAPFAFGPCFDRRDKRYGEYERGFDLEASLREPKAIRNLVRGSAAEAAGLAEGDAIAEFSPGPSDPTKEVSLRVKKADGKTRDVRYLPARPGTSLEGFEWVRVEGIPDERCGDPPRLGPL